MGREGAPRAVHSRTRLALPAIEILLALGGGLFMAIGPPFTADPTLQLLEGGFFLVLVIFCSAPVVRLDRGQLRLTMIATQAAAMVLTPVLAGLAGLTAGLSWFMHEPVGKRYAGVSAAMFWTSGAALCRLLIGTGSPIRQAAGLVVVAVSMTLANWTLTLAELALTTGEPIGAIARAAFTRPFLAAFAYFSLAAILIANLMDGSPRGYLLSSIVVLLAVTLTETLAERRSRTALEAQVADNQRYIAYSRALDGIVHGLRHQLAISKIYLENVLEARLPEKVRTQVAGGKASTDAALDLLERLEASASPRVEFPATAVDLKDVATSSAGFVRGMAAGQGTRIEVGVRDAVVPIAADPVLLRDVVTGLLINSLQAVEHGGWVRISVSSRRGGWACLTIADSGPGISELERDHLFEPHYTTKPNGTGLGLFTAYGVVREHRGHLVYEGGPRTGAIFSVLIPLVDSTDKGAEAVTEPRDGLNPVRIAERFPR